MVGVFAVRGRCGTGRACIRRLRCIAQIDDADIDQTRQFTLSGRHWNVRDTLIVRRKFLSEWFELPVMLHHHSLLGGTVFMRNWDGWFAVVLFVGSYLKEKIMEIQDAIRHALDGRAILFTGAGFSYGAKNIDGDPLPAGRALARRLLKEVGYKNLDGGLDKASAAYLRRKSDEDLVKLLINVFSVGHLTQSQIALSALPWRRIYTTNYDMVLEEASREAKVIRNSVDCIDPPQEHLAKPNLVIHLNGAITRLTPERLHSSFKLVSESYAADSFDKSGWAFHFRNDIRTATAIIFIGYSMYDLDLRRILYGEDVSDKSFFVIAPIDSENELDAEDLADLGHLAPIGIDKFADIVEATKTTYLPRSPELLLDAWEKILLIQAGSSSPRDSDVLDFLTIGQIRKNLLLEACGPEAGNYVVPLDLISNIVTTLLQSKKDALLIGALGTGKTFICDCVAQLMLVRGWDAFKVSLTSDDEIAEAERICEIPGPKLLIIENYHRHMDLLRWIAETNPQEVAILTTARVHVHELFAADYFEIMGDACIVFDTSELSKSEVNAAVKLFDNHGLWGDRISWPMQRKVGFVAHDCKSQLPFLLIDILKSQHVTERFRELIAQSINRSDVEELLICTFSLEVMQFQPRINHIQELLANRVQWTKIRRQTELKPIIDFSTHDIHIKSAILANHLLHTVFSAKKIVATLIGMATEAEARRRDSAFYQIFNSLMRFSQISLLLPESNRLDAAMSYYEGVKNLPSARSDPQFWLQYAISCLAFGKLDRAERYFDDAYEFAKKRPDYNTFQIDNHYARLLLEKALLASAIDDLIEFVDEAKKIIFQQFSTETRYHPYRVAVGLFKCFERFKGQLNVDQHKYFKRIFEEIKRRCESASIALQRDKYVKECLKNSNQLLAAIDTL